MRRFRPSSLVLHPSSRSGCIFNSETPAVSSRQLHGITPTSCKTCNRKNGDQKDEDIKGENDNADVDDNGGARTSRKIFSGTSRPGSLADRNTSDLESDAGRCCLFKLVSGYALFAKRPSRAFPPPFLSPPSTSFSEPLSAERPRTEKNEQQYENETIRGMTNGDDAALASDRLLAVNDGVGAWAVRESGHAALWSRLILHFWAQEAEKDEYGNGSSGSKPAPQAYLQRAYEHTKKATGTPNEFLGTTTFTGAILDVEKATNIPRLCVTQLGDSKVMVLRPRSGSIIYKTIEQWHWFDCPRQLGTNSPDTPNDHAVTDIFHIEEGDVVVAMSDGVSDNLWEHEVVSNVLQNATKADLVTTTSSPPKEPLSASPPPGRSMSEQSSEHHVAQGMHLVARELVKAARLVAEDPFAESPFMERAVEEGLPTEGGAYTISSLTFPAAVLVVVVLFSGGK
ncbi:MAG: hypothetical protein M1831_007450 [Alyxoria varia]|nr:MAG: hypothetical protein M1831_007450 [Alyxoria varia]